MDTVFWTLLILIILIFFYVISTGYVENFNYMQSPPVCYYADDKLKQEFINSYRCNIPKKDVNRVFKEFCFNDGGYFAEWATRQGYKCPENYFG